MSSSDSPLTQITDLMSSSLIYLSSSSYPLAEDSYARALDLSEKTYGEAHPTTVKCLEYLSRCLKMQGKWDLSVKMLERVVSLREEMEGEDDAGMLGVYSDLEECCREMGRGEEGEGWRRRRKMVMGVMKQRIEENEQKEEKEEEVESEEEEEEGKEGFSDSEEENKDGDDGDNSNDENNEENRKRWNL
ncbi:hypothetical protein TrST_g13438 [Triparma strigata]|uniref:Kinesin light chain n=1 Tax=Triparma strigata TaxID=1606541 RepID=A0A9W7BPF8_9STRA|nr:hypothetical protein TrST_g13438 [Triparma strigata]